MLQFKLQQLFKRGFWLLPSTRKKIVAVVAGIPDEAYWSKFKATITGK